jgi:hypothetical protein
MKLILAKLAATVILCGSTAAISATHPALTGGKRNENILQRAVEKRYKLPKGAHPLLLPGGLGTV